MHNLLYKLLYCCTIISPWTKQLFAELELILQINGLCLISFHIVSLRAWGLITEYEIREIRECLDVGVVGLDDSAPFFRTLRRYMRDIRVKFVIIFKGKEVQSW